MARLAGFHSAGIPRVRWIRVVCIQQGMGISASAIMAGHAGQPRWLGLPRPRRIRAMALAAVPYILGEDYLPAKVRIALVDLLRMFQICTAVNLVDPSYSGHRAVAAPTAQCGPSLITETISCSISRIVMAGPAVIGVKICCM